MDTPPQSPPTPPHRIRRMSGRDPGESFRVASPLELLLDLTFVIAFGVAGNQAAHLIAEGASDIRDRRVRFRDVGGVLGVGELRVVRLRVRH